MPQRYPATPAGTYPTSLTVAPPQRTLAEALTRIGPYNAGANTTRAAMSPQRQSEWAMTSTLPTTLRDVLQQQMISNPTQSGRVTDAVHAYDLQQRLAHARPEEVAGLEAAMRAMGPSASQGGPMGAAAGGGGAASAGAQRGRDGAVSAAAGLPGATVGFVNGKRVLIPQAGHADTYAASVNMANEKLGLSLNPNDVIDANGAQGQISGALYRKEAARQKNEKVTIARAAAAEKQKADEAAARALELERVKGANAATTAGITAGGKDAKARAGDEKALRAQLGAAELAAKNRYVGLKNEVIRGVNIDFSKKGLQPHGPEWRQEVQRRMRDAGIPLDDKEFVSDQLRTHFSNSLGTTPESQWKTNLANQLYPGAFPAPPAQPAAPNADAAPYVPDDAMRAQLLAPIGAAGPEAAQSDPAFAASPQAAPEVAQAAAAHGEDPPITPQEIAAVGDSQTLLRIAEEHEKANVPPELHQHYVAAAAQARQRAAALQRAGL